MWYRFGSKPAVALPFQRDVEPSELPGVVEAGQEARTGRTQQRSNLRVLAQIDGKVVAMWRHSLPQSIDSLTPTVFCPNADRAWKNSKGIMLSMLGPACRRAVVGLDSTSMRAAGKRSFSRRIAGRAVMKSPM